MSDDYSQQFEGLVAAILGECPSGTGKTYRFFESKIPYPERADFLSLMAIELLEKQEKIAATHDTEVEIKKMFERIVKRLYRAAIDKNKRETPLVIDVPSATHTQENEGRDKLFAAIADFEPSDLSLVLMRLEGHTLAHIAKTSGVSASTIQRKWVQIMKRLKELGPRT